MKTEKIEYALETMRDSGTGGLTQPRCQEQADEAFIELTALQAKLARYENLLAEIDDMCVVSGLTIGKRIEEALCSRNANEPADRTSDVQLSQPDQAIAESGYQAQPGSHTVAPGAIMVERLREIEWSSIDGQDRRCPVCDGAKPPSMSRTGHFPDCWLGNLLSKTTQDVE